MITIHRKCLLVTALLLALVSVAAAQQVAPAAGLGLLDGYVHDLSYVELKLAIASLPSSPERDYFEGVLANREGRLAESVSLLEKSLPEIKKTSPARAAVALEALGDDYVKQYRYADAVNVYADLLQHFEKFVDEAMLKDNKDDYGAVQVLKSAPPQSLVVNGPVSLPTSRNPKIGTIETNLAVNGVTESWILDTGANFSVVSETLARRMKLKFLAGDAQTQGITGAENKLHIAILPELPLGTTVVKNVVLLVLQDKSLELPLSKDSVVQIHAILGYPVMQALGRISFTHDGHFMADSTQLASSEGAPLFMQKLTPLLQCRVEGHDLIFSFDSGATSTAFTDRYYRAFPEQFRGLKKQSYAIGGAGGVRKFEVYRLPAPTLGVGATTAVLKNVAVLPPLGTTTDRTFGNIGRDLTDQYESFTIDFRSMRFELGKELAQTKQRRQMASPSPIAQSLFSTD